MHKLLRLYLDSRSKGSYAYSCSCGHREGDYLVKEYAEDGWREHAGLEPIYGLLV